jgi:alpha-L-rhamnosidase
MFALRHISSVAFSILCVSSFAFAADSPVKLAELTAEHMTNPVGVGFTQPRLSWKLISDRAGEVQTAYEIRAASTREKLTSQPDLWSSGKVSSDQSWLVKWGGKELGSRAQVFWQVRIWDKDDKSSDWSEPASIELGLLRPETEWKGQWITVDLPRIDIMKAPLTNAKWINAGSASNQAAGARYVLNLPNDAKVRSASIDVAADGLISLYVNGKPTLQGSTSHTAPFYADFGQQLVPGKNIIAVGSGAVRGARGGGRNALAAHVVVELENGQKIEIHTDDSWKAGIPVTAARGFGAGPAAAQPAGAWYSPDFDDSTWQAATVIGPYAEVPTIPSADNTVGPVRYLRKTFTPKGPIAKARLYATALGAYEASINGKPVSEDLLAPGWTDYNQRVMVQTYDVTNLLTSGGPNAIGAMISDGWFAGRVGWTGLFQYSRVGRNALFNAQLEITYADGTTETIATDDSWNGGPGAIVGSDMQLGEIIDHRQAIAYDQPSFDDKSMKAVVIEQHPNIALNPQLGPPVRRLMELAPKKISQMGSVWIVDFGQNMVGHVKLIAKGPPGTTIDVTHAEMLNADGSLYTENLRTAISLDTFILKGDASPETFEPQFTFHGFRYVGIAGYPGQLTPESIRGVVIGSDTPDIGTFESSNPDVNQLFSNIRWGQRGNFISVPTDCPQRDERMGWMGDAQVFAPTAAYNADVAPFFAKWLRDVNDAQRADGAFNNVSPKGNENQSYPVWADAGVIIPWVMYTTYGDKAFLENSYPNMVKYLEYCQQTSPNLTHSGRGVGDHLAPRGGAGARAGGAGGARGLARGPTSGPVISTSAVVETAYFARSAWIVSQSAKLLGKPEDAARFDKLYHDVCDAFNKAYVQEDGTIRAGTQTTYVLALMFNLLPENMRAAAIKHLTDDVQERGHLSTGFVGVGFLNIALSSIGRSDLAYQLLLTDTYPSWLFSVKHGATTMWERWDGWTPETGFQASSMNSFNHYSFGAVGKWLYCGAAGIDIDEQNPGFKHFKLNPQLTSKLTSVKATYNSPYGVISSSWKLENGEYLYDAVVPPNSTATLTLPGMPQTQLVAGKYHFTVTASNGK